MARVFETHGSALVGTTATLALEKVHEEIVRNWGWLLVSIGITVGGSFLGFFLVGFLGVVVGLALGLVSYLTGRRGETVMREIERR
jgi:ABC-type nitrate/sulfonate/bicarbonate transport system permease component